MKEVIVSNIKEVKINKGDFYSKECVEKGKPYRIVVINSKLIDEVKDCVIGEDDKEESISWINSIISHVACDEEERVKVYKVDESYKK